MAGLDRLFRPKSVAVIGGGYWARSIIEQCRKIGFQGAIYPIYPRATDVDGIPVYRTLADLPETPDAAFICVNRNATIDVVRELSQMGAGGAVCFASGFLESQAETQDGASLQAELVSAAGDMPIVGPNCYGFVNYLDQACLWPDQHGGIPVDRGVAIITQSSNIAINLSMHTRAMPIAYLMTAGNQAKVSMADLARFVLADPRVTALGLHIEGLGDPNEFLQLAQEAHAMGKGIVVIKVGASDQAQAATISHTASLAGSAAGASAIFERLGVAQVQDLTTFMDTLMVLHHVGPLNGDTVATISCSGGEASLMADLGQAVRVEFPDLVPNQRDALRYALGDKVALANPLDYHTYIWGDGAAMGRCYAAMMLGDQDATILVVDFPRADRCSQSAWDCVIEGVEYAHAQSDRVLILAASLAENMPEHVAERLGALGIPCLNGLRESLEAVRAAAAVGQGIQNDQPLWISTPSETSVTLSEAEAKADLAQSGLTVPAARVVSLDDIDNQGDFPFPAVIKAQGLAHKSDAGGVALNLTSMDAVKSAAQNMGSDSFLMEQMITGAVCEILIGVVADPAHGFVLTLAAGGVMTEILKDSTTLVLPVTPQDVTEAFQRLKIAPILNGYRGQPAADMAALVDAVMSVQSYVQQNMDDVLEVEINPIIATPTTAIAVDALIRRAT
ncbi:MAG: acetate--CoA ligase family protein [Paracoccaceae bacterium]|jgi:acyl-CoA synthetase (NDP forming)